MLQHALMKVLHHQPAVTLRAAVCLLRACALSMHAASTQHSTAFLSGADQPKLALVLLNVDRGEALQTSLLSSLWSHASVKVCADGAANRLHDSLPEEERSTMLPDLIIGDLDSLRDDVASYYQAKGVRTTEEPDQDSHDFEKCLRWLEQRQLEEQQSGDATPFSVVAFGAFGGRLDQTMANLNMLYAFCRFERFVLLCEASLAFLLPPGKNVIAPNRRLESGSCGLIPLGGRCDRVTTSGLRWDLDGSAPLEFGSLVSSSNEVVGSQVVIETESPLLWTSNLLPSPR